MWQNSGHINRNHNIYWSKKYIVTSRHTENKIALVTKGNPEGTKVLLVSLHTYNKNIGDHWEDAVIYIKRVIYIKSSDLHK